MIKVTWNCERGQGVVEYTGALAFIAAIVAALVLAGIPAGVASAVQCSVNKILGSNATCQSAPTSAGGPGQVQPWNSPNPVTRATWGQYVSIGDSYASGEGLGNYQPNSHIAKSRCAYPWFSSHGCLYHKNPQVLVGCDRSAAASNSTVSNQQSFKGGKQTWACSGATTQDIYDGPTDPTCSKWKSNGGSHEHGNYGEGCQVDHVNAGTSLVTLSVGGDDADFSGDLLSCYEHDLAKGASLGLGAGGSCNFESAPINQKIKAIGSTLIPDLQAIRARAPHSRIIIITYPLLFPQPPTQNSGCVGPNVCLTPADQAFFNQEGINLDNSICADAQAANVGAECINASNAFQGCEIGQPNSCLQSPQLHIQDNGLNVPLGTNIGAYHPTARGQQVLGQLLNEEIAHPEPGTGGPTGP